MSVSLRKLSPVLFMLAVRLPLSAGEPVVELAAAVQRLAEVPGYTWKAEVHHLNTGVPQLARGATTRFEGEADRDGFSVVRDTRTGPRTEYARFQSQMLTRIEGSDWLSLDQIVGRVNSSGNMSISVAPAATGRSLNLMRMVGNGRLAPHEELAQLIPKARNVLQTASGWTFELSAEDTLHVMPYYTPPAAPRKDGRVPPKPTRTSATVTVSAEDGLLRSYVLHVEGHLVDRKGDDQTISRTKQVTLSNVGQAKVSLPEAARLRLRSMVTGGAKEKP